MRIAVLGELEISYGHDEQHGALEEGNRHRAMRLRNLICMLAAVAALEDRGLAAQELQTLLWGWDPEYRDYARPLAQLVYRARKVVGDKRLISANGPRGESGYRLVLHPDDENDIEEFTRAATLATRARNSDDLERAAALYGDALKLWRGDPRQPFPDFPEHMSGSNWFRPLIAQRRKAIEAYAEVHLELGWHSVDLVESLARYLHGDQRLNEHLWALYMLTLYRSGRLAEASQAFEEATKILNQFHDVSPGVELHRMAQRIRRRDPDLDWALPKGQAKLQMSTSGPIPTVRGVYDVTLRGKDNAEPDRNFVRDLVERTGTDTPMLADENRECIVRMVRFLAKNGVRQFLDLGSGMPEPQGRDVPRIARQVDPQARVLMIDNDPLVAVHINALIADGADVLFGEIDITDVEGVLYEAKVRARFDFSEPIALLCANTLQYIPADRLRPTESHAGAEDALAEDRWTDTIVAMMQRYIDALPSGSYVAITHLSDDRLHPEIKPHLDARNPDAELPMHLRSPEQIARTFCGLPLVPDGVADVGLWRPEKPFQKRQMRIIGGIAFKE